MKVLQFILSFAQTIIVCRGASAGGVSPLGEIDVDGDSHINIKPAGAAAAQTFGSTGVE